MAQSAGEGYCRKATKRASVADPDVAQKLALDLKQPKILLFFGVLEIRMKKFLVVFAVLAVLIFVVSCGGGSKTNDTTGTGDTVTDEDAVGDTVTDEDAVGDTVTDEDAVGDTVTDEDAVDTIPANLPECSPTSETPCYDSSSELIWSKKADDEMEHYDAELYCESYSEAGLSGWRLPNIDELKTLLIWSKADSCKVSEENRCCHYHCWSCGSCTEEGNNCSQVLTLYDDGRYSKLGDIGFFWSSSSVWPSSILRSDDDDFVYCEFCEDAWGVSFSSGGVFHINMELYNSVRCVRNAD